MERKIRIGIHGCGRGQDFIRLLGLLTDEAEITALCDNREKTLSRAKELCAGNPRLFSDFDDFIRCDMDGVILCNFFHEHVPCAIKALERGIAVLSETTAAGTLAEKAGHNGGDYWVIRHFLSYISDDIPPFFDVYRAAAMSAIGILAWRSSFENGKEYRIPDFRREEERMLYENDTASPFPGAENQCVPPSSQPYKPDLV